jgi:hypothetical protein
MSVEPATGCFYCDGHTDYHPTCDRPGCETATHGFGKDGGKRTVAYCDEHREDGR